MAQCSPPLIAGVIGIDDNQHTVYENVSNEASDGGVASI
jgi:hypothetical protein